MKMITINLTPPMRKMLAITGIFFAIIFGWCGLKKVFISVMMSHYQPPPSTVTAKTINTQSWQTYINSVGSLTAVNGVDISSEASGIVTAIHFVAGQLVKQGDVLIELDNSIEQAELKIGESKLKLAQLNFDRNQTLAKKNITSHSEFDAISAQLQQAQAGVEEIQAKIRQKVLSAPFTGKIGIPQVNIGQYVAAGTAMVSLQAQDPLHLRFNVPEQYLPQLYLQQPVNVILNIEGKKTIPGVITAINSKVDETTHNVLVEATIPNQDLQLYPGMFASVQVLLTPQNNQIVIPQTAISYSLHGDSVYIVRNDSKKKNKPLLHAYRQYVQVGDRRGDSVTISKGLNSGDQIVTSGQLKLHDGSAVIVDNTIDL